MIVRTVRSGEDCCSDRRRRIGGADTVGLVLRDTLVVDLAQANAALEKSRETARASATSAPARAAASVRATENRGADVGERSARVVDELNGDVGPNDVIDTCISEETLHRELFDQVASSAHDGIHANDDTAARRTQEAIRQDPNRLETGGVARCDFVEACDDVA